MSTSDHVLAVGDPIRPILGRAVKLTIIAATVFTGFAYFAKEIPSLYAHEPWQDDPYDTFVSFAIICVPLLAAVSFLRIPLLKKNRELPVQRVRDLLRGCRLIVVIAVATIIADWTSVVLRADRATWDSNTGLPIVLLLATTAVVGLAAFSIVRVPLSQSRSASRPDSIDGLSDAMLVFKQWTSSLGPANVAVGSLLSWVDDHVLSKIRSHPLITATIFSSVFGFAVASAQAFGEGIQKWPLLLFFFSVTTSTLFAFVVIGGHSLGVIRNGRPVGGSKRRMIDATVAAAAVVPLCVAFRSSLGHLIGASSGSLDSVGVLLIGAAVATFILVLIFETLIGANEH